SNRDSIEALKEKRISFGEGTDTQILSESCSISHHFSYHTLIGKGVPFAQHMGITSRAYSTDLLFNEQTKNTELEKFIEFKEMADEIIRSTERMDRVSGWKLRSPIAKLLGIPQSANMSMSTRPGEGIFVPMSTYIDTSEQPNLKNMRIDMVENNMEFFKDHEITLHEGGTEYKELKEFYLNKILKGEVAVRKNMQKDLVKAASLIQGSSADFYRTFWPLRSSEIFVDESSGDFGILNGDSLRAAFLSDKFDTSGELVRALQGSKLATGRVVAGKNEIAFVKRARLAGSTIWQTLTKPDTANTEAQKILVTIKKYVQTKFVRVSPGSSTDDLVDQLSQLIFESFVGDRSNANFFINNFSSASKALKLIAGTDIEFHEDFKEALFEVLVERIGPPIFLGKAFSVNGLYSGYF
ncbi:MAG: hypothetical protein GY861_25940, partial [bacterium]|nr:hypothetical protein [bacterium]